MAKPKGQSLNKVVVTGATGLIGGHLLNTLRGKAGHITVLTRNAAAAREAVGSGIDLFQWLPHDTTALAERLEGADAIFHLAGAGIADRRWNPQYKEKLVTSRINSTAELVAAIAHCKQKPRALVNASAIGYYGPASEEPLDESSRAGTSFLADLCVRWEVAAEQAAAHGVRVVRVRVGIVLAPDGGPLQKLLLPFRLCVGGPIASGRQGMSWVHIDDMVGLLLHAATTDGLDGPLNGTAPNPVSNRDFSRILGRVLHRPAFMPLPGFMLRLLVGEMADELLIGGQYVVPARLLESGFQFRYSELESALHDLTS